MTKWWNHVFFPATVGLEPPPLSVSEERHLAILTELPFVVPFEERVKVRKFIYSAFVCQIALWSSPTFRKYFEDSQLRLCWRKCKTSSLILSCFVPQIFQRLIYADKRDIQGDGPFLDGINVTIRRNYIYEDAYDKLSPENGNEGCCYRNDNLVNTLI